MSDKKSIHPNHLQKIEELALHINQFKKSLNIGTSSLTPLNYQEEYDKFFASSTYNPKYVYKKREYPDIAAAIDRYKEDFLNIPMPYDLQDHIQEFLDDLKILYFTKKSIGTDDFTTHASRLFDWGSDRLDILLSSTPKVQFTMDIEHKIRDANFIKERFEKTLVKYGITSFKVNLDTFSPHIINVGYQNIYIGSAIKRFECNIDRLIVHEIESHVLQMENTKKARTGLAGFAKYGNQH